MQSESELAQKVRRIAARIHRSIPSDANVDLEDLVQDGMVGLLEAKRRYDPQRGVDFPVFADARISGAIHDGMRSLDWCGRTARAQIKHYWTTISQLTHELCRAPSSDEAAAAASLSLAEFFRAQNMAHAANLISLSTPVEKLDHDATIEDMIVDHRAVDGLEMAVLKEHQKLLRGAFRKLNAQERQAVWLYYLDSNDYTQEEVARFMGVGFARVSQLCTNARKKLEVELRKHQEFGSRGNKANVIANANACDCGRELRAQPRQSERISSQSHLRLHLGRHRRMGHDRVARALR